ncbi:hypothetical protein B0I35DRAFT_431597 [Stachybotrys elegans]|uniref:Uncharacterized protein n=1 Tax=Stachybotrys elegans TaxID=80388 RepID=A0A8K0WRN8_9HYPO|nr:hypothetical protein B0I35DRAFT_431597 [Stachybotrys elegans]
MALHHAKTLIRPVAAPLLRPAQRRTVTRGDRDDMGGPYGQEPRPPRPGGFDVIKRNWVAFAGAGVVGIFALSYVGRKKEAQREGKYGDEVSRR